VIGQLGLAPVWRPDANRFQALGGRQRADRCEQALEEPSFRLAALVGLEDLVGRGVPWRLDSSSVHWRGSFLD
jgi:hypothetical protein